MGMDENGVITQVGEYFEMEISCSTLGCENFGHPLIMVVLEETEIRCGPCGALIEDGVKVE